MSQEPAPIVNAYVEEGQKQSGDAFRVAFEKRIREIRTRSMEEKKMSCLSYRGAMEWSGIKTQEQFDKARLKASEDYWNGSFFMERIGRYRSVDPSLTLTVLNLRLEWIKEYDIKTIPEYMLLDMALTSYFHFIRLNEDINSTMASIEWDFFALDAPVFQKNAYGKRLNSREEDQAIAEKLAYRLQEILQPVIEQYQRMFIRSLKALRDLRRGNIQLNIGNVGQMNIGEQQVNVDKGV